MVKRMTPVPLQMPLRIAATEVVRLRERRRAVHIASKSPIRLHLGSASSSKSEWANVDLVGLQPSDLRWNLLRRLPFSPQSVDAIFHEHVLEHFSLRHGLVIVDDAFRLLRPGGVLRIGVPDAGAYIRDYVHRGSMLATARPGRATPMLALQEVFYCCGHRTMYDADTLTLLVRAAGFDVVEERAFGESRLSPCPDSAHRRRDTVYVEAVR
jgi:SAM-dependent methyltransferase